MVYEQDLVVTEIKADFDPFGGEYVHVSLAYRLPIPMPPAPSTQTLPPRPQPVMYKHVIHVIIPRESWTGQYTMWEPLHVRIEDNGTIRVTRPKR